MGTVCFRKQFHVSSACKNPKLKSSHDWKAKSSGWGPGREMSGVCWGSFTLLGDRRRGWWGDELVPFAPLWACSYPSEATWPLLLLRRLGLLVLIPKGFLTIVICARVEPLPRKGPLSASHGQVVWLVQSGPFQVLQEAGKCSAGSCGMGWCCCGPKVLLPIRARDGVMFQGVPEAFSLGTTIPCGTRHLILLLWEGMAERVGSRGTVPSPCPLEGALFN